MKIFYTFLFSALVITSCETSEKETSTTDKKGLEQEKVSVTDNDKLSTRWVLINRRNAEGNKSKDFEKEPTSIVTYFEDNGYFRIYDSITEARNEDGVQKIEQRRSGQWEIDENGLLVLRYTEPDTVILERFSIEELDKNKLVIKSKKKDIISTYERKL